MGCVHASLVPEMRSDVPPNFVDQFPYYLKARNGYFEVGIGHQLHEEGHELLQVGHHSRFVVGVLQGLMQGIDCRRS